jgi:hypothetical protein
LLEYKAILSYLKTLKKLLPIVLETITGVVHLLPPSKVATVVPIAAATAAIAIVARTDQQTEVATVGMPTQPIKLQRSNNFAGATAREDLIVVTIVRMPTMEALALITSSTFVATHNTGNQEANAITQRRGNAPTRNINPNEALVAEDNEEEACMVILNEEGDEDALIYPWSDSG